MSNEYLQRHLNTTALLQIMSAHEVPLQMLLDVLPARLHVAVALSGKCCKDELSGQQTCSKQICMLVRIKPGEVRALFVSRVRPSAPPCCLFSLVVFLSPCCYFGAVCVMSESPRSISSSSSSSSGASGQTLGQRLTYFIRLSGRRDRSNTTRVDAEEEEEEEEEDGGAELGRRGLSQSPCSICLPHPSPLHILRRAETASHAETNVKINHYDLSCSALTCSPPVTFPFHSHSRAISSSPNKTDPPFTHWVSPPPQPPPPFYAKRAAATMSSPSVLSLA